MQNIEITARWRVESHLFEATATVSDGVLTLRIAAPAAFIGDATAEQRRRYGEARTRALDDLATVIADIHGHEADEINNIHH